MEAWQEYQRISRSLRPNVKLKVRQAAPLYAERARTLPTPHALRLAAETVLRSPFPAASPAQMNVLVFYLLGVVAAAEGARGLSADRGAAELDSLSEMGEMESLRLQMTMDRRSKLMSALSNLLKKSSETANNIVQNIK